MLVGPSNGRLQRWPGLATIMDARAPLGQGRGLYDVFGLAARLSAEPASVLTKALGIFHGAASSPRDPRPEPEPAYHASIYLAAFSDVVRITTRIVRFPMRRAHNPADGSRLRRV